MFKNCLLVASMMLAVLSGKAQILSNGDIYDVSVGDKFAYTDYIYRGTTGPPLYVFKKVIDKQIFGRDSLHLTYYVGTYGYEYPSWVNRSYQEKLSIYKLDSPWLSDFGKKDTFYRYYGESDTLKKNPYGYSLLRDSINSDSCGTVFNVRYTYSMALLSGFNEMSLNAYKGIGILNSRKNADGGNVYGTKKTLNYYFHQNQYCGSKLFPVNLDHPVWLQLSISPNPASAELMIQLPLSGQYSIRNSLGQELISGNLSGENIDQKIDIATLNNGVYTIVLHSAQQNYTARFIKQ
jgi:hypothetical protein